jgi:hypothetical protein
MFCANAGPVYRQSFKDGPLSFAEASYTILIFVVDLSLHPGDLDMLKSTGTSCQIEIHFMIKTTEYLL